MPVLTHIARAALLTVVLGGAACHTPVVSQPRPAHESKPALTKNKSNPAALMGRGRRFYHLRRYEEALLCFRTLRTKYPISRNAQLAAYGEIVIMDKLKQNAGLLDLCRDFLKAYPDSEYCEQVGTIAGERLVQESKWKEVGPFYQDLADRFPRSVNMDRFLFYQALSAFMEAEFATSTPLFEKLISKFPKSPFHEAVLYL